MTKLIGLHIDLEEKLEEICWRFLWIKWNRCIWTCMHLRKSLEMIFFLGPYIIFILVWWRHYIHVWIVLCEPFAKENCPYSYQSNSCNFQSLNILNYLCFYLLPQMCKKVASFKLDIPIWFLINKLINAWQLDIDSKESKYPMGVFQVYILLGVSDQYCVTNTLLYRMEISWFFPLIISISNLVWHFKKVNSKYNATKFGTQQCP